MGNIPCGISRYNPGGKGDTAIDSGAEKSVEERGKWIALALLATALILSMTTWFSASAVVPQLRSEWGLSDGAAAWLTISVQLGFVAGAVVSSFFNLADIVSPRYVIFAGAIGAAVANGLFGLADGAASGIPLRFATGFFLAGVYPPALKLISTWFLTGRGVALGVLVGALTIGSAMPHLVNGLGGLSWGVVIFATSILTLIGGIIAGFIVKDGPHPFPRAVFDPRQAAALFTNRGVRLASFGYFGHMWELYAMWAWFLVFFSDALTEVGIPSGQTAAYATFAVISVGAFGCIIGGIMGDKWGRTNTTALMMAVSGACALGIGFLFGGAAWLILVVGLIWGFTVVADSAQFSTMCTEMADQSYVGTVLTLQLALGFILTVATIWLIPVAETLVSWQWAFIILVPGPIFGLLSMLRLRSLPEAEKIAGGRG